MRSLADRLVKPVLVQFGGSVWKLLITYGVLLDCESESDADMLGSTEAIASPSARVLRALFWAALQRAGASWSIEQVGSMMEPGEIGKIKAALQQAFAASLPKRDSAVKKKMRKDAPSRPPMNKVQLRASARQELGLSDDEWTEMTPLELHEMRLLYLNNLQTHELHFSRLTTAVMNFSGRLTKWLEEGHFMAHPLPKRERQGGSTGEDILGKFEAYEAT